MRHQQEGHRAAAGVLGLVAGSWRRSSVGGGRLIKNMARVRGEVNHGGGSERQNCHDREVSRPILVRLNLEHLSAMPSSGEESSAQSCDRRASSWFWQEQIIITNHDSLIGKVFVDEHVIDRGGEEPGLFANSLGDLRDPRRHWWRTGDDETKSEGLH